MKDSFLLEEKGDLRSRFFETRFLVYGRWDLRCAMKGVVVVTHAHGVVCGWWMLGESEKRELIVEKFNT